MRMTTRQLSLYAGHIAALRADESLNGAAVASIPHMADDARMNVFSAWRDAAGLGAVRLADLYPKASIGDAKKSINEG